MNNTLSYKERMDVLRRKATVKAEQQLSQAVDGRIEERVDEIFEAFEDYIRTTPGNPFQFRVSGCELSNKQFSQLGTELRRVGFIVDANARAPFSYILIRIPSKK